MGSLMVRKRSSLAVAKKVGAVVLVCWLALEVLPVIVGTGLIAGAIGVGLLFTLVSWLLSAAIWIGVPVAGVALLVALLSSDD